VAVSVAELDVFGNSLDRAAEWSEYWSVNVRVHGRDVGSSTGDLALYGEYANVMKDACEDVVGVVNVSVLTLSANVSEEESAVGLLQVYPLASLSGRVGGYLVLAFQFKRNAAQKLVVTRPLPISCRRDLGHWSFARWCSRTRWC